MFFIVFKFAASSPLSLFILSYSACCIQCKPYANPSGENYFRGRGISGPGADLHCAPAQRWRPREGAGTTRGWGTWKTRTPALTSAALRPPLVPPRGGGDNKGKGNIGCWEHRGWAILKTRTPLPHQGLGLFAGIRPRKSEGLLCHSSKP